MTKEQLEELKNIILEKINDLVGQLEAEHKTIGEKLIDSTGDISVYATHTADIGTDAMEREKAFFMATREGRYLYHLKEALERIEKGTYDGKCKVCGKEINFERLKAVPHASKCIECKTAEEKAKIV